jgi:predicted secreted hydrolase
MMSGCNTDSLYERYADKPVVRLPKDESPHDSGGEWWYYTGTLDASSGEKFGVEAVVFHMSGSRLGLPIVDAWVSHFALLNKTTQEYIYDQSYRLDWFPFLSLQNSEGFDLDTPQIQMNGFDGSDHISAAMGDETYVLDIDLTDERGVIFHGVDGYVPYGDNLNAFYYSRPIMQASGTLTTQGRTLAVQGDLWFDRQWGRDVIDPHSRWKWFSLRLDDGSCVMLFAFLDADPVLYEGTYIPAAGDAIALSENDFTLTDTAWWTSPCTNVTYPVAWDITIESLSLTLHLAAVENNQEFDARETSGNIYWEGLCTMEGRQGEKSMTGSAYVELTNF